MNYTIYIAAAAVMLVLIVLAALSISFLQRSVIRSIRSRTMGLLSLYDDLLEEKSKALEAMPQATAPVEAAAAAVSAEGDDPEVAQRLSAATLSTAERSVGVPYREKSVSQVYGVIRQNFAYSLEEVLPLLEQASPKAEGTATALLRQLPYETVYQLSTLPGEDQYAILAQTLTREQQELLERYRETARSFSALGFYDSLQSTAASEPGPARLRVAPGTAANRPDSPIQILTDGEICEGYQIEQDNLLYDFSIKTRELS